MTQNKFKDRKIIGLTGGIATGKSTVVEILRKRGHPVIDSDKIARQVVQVGKRAYRDIIDAFGLNILNKDTTINRKKLGEIVFGDDEKRKMLNKIVHPRVVEEITSQIENLSRDTKVVFIDIPLLLEEKNKLESLGLHFNEIWLVFVDEKTQLNRLMMRDNLNEQDAYKRINAQMTIEEKKKYANKIIDNTGTLGELEKNVDRLLKDI